MELRLHSPAGAEPIVYQWPLTSGSGSVSDSFSFFFPPFRVAMASRVPRTIRIIIIIIVHVCSYHGLEGYLGNHPAIILVLPLWNNIIE